MLSVRKDDHHRIRDVDDCGGRMQALPQRLRRAGCTGAAGKGNSSSGMEVFDAKDDAAGKESLWEQE